MRRSRQAAVHLAERLCRPQRIGVFGHRGVGKTTLLTMLYREAVGGRLPGLRLAAADARTANYLADKILQLESGQALPGTLAETELRFHLYRGEARFDLLVKDYQGEHIELGREEPIREFLRDCDAVWLCFDAGQIDAGAEGLKRQQEAEQLLEDCLALEGQTTLERPAALVLTKADLLDKLPDQLDALPPGPLQMTRHALEAHCPRRGMFAVSSLRQAVEKQLTLEPHNLAAPLHWLAEALRAQDETRLERLWSLAARDFTLLDRCLACFSRRYPKATSAANYRQRLGELRTRRYLRRGWLSAAAVASLALTLLGYDAIGYYRASKFESEHAGEFGNLLEHWRSYQTWHPTRNLFRPAAAQAEEEHVRWLEREQQLTALRGQAHDPDADPLVAWQRFQEYRANFSDAGDDRVVEPLRSQLKSRRDEQLGRQAQRAYDQLLRSEQESVDLMEQVAQANEFLRNYAETPHADEVGRRRTAYLLRLDERDIESARNYSAQLPFNFLSRREQYQRYLDKHPSGAFVEEATTALRAIDSDWDKHDFRLVRDQYEAQPGNIPELVARCRAYLAVHPRGRFVSAAGDLLRWTERVTTRGQYRVTLRSGQVETRLAHFFSRGPDLSVEIEVAGARYGPSNIVVNRYDPDWDYVFPRRVAWKLGDPVRIRVTDHDYFDRVIVQIASDDGDPLAIRLLCGDAWSGSNRVTFESDFQMPVLPKIE
jgi:hypothetical protein